MKRILRDIKTGLLFKSLDEWTTHYAEAFAFPDTVSALGFCRQNDLSGVEIVLKFPDGSRDVVLGFRRFVPPKPETERQAIPEQKTVKVGEPAPEVAAR